jgi:Uma2 family endonuclease
VEAQPTYDIMELMYEIGVLIDGEHEKEKPRQCSMGKQKERISLEEFFALVESDPEHRYEYIEGYANMMTGGTPDHSIIGANMNRIFGEQLRKRPCIVYNSDVYIELTDKTNCLCPDASVSCDRRDRHAVKVIHYPCVVAEVLSSGTKAHDRGIKSELYQNIPTVQEILFIDTQVMRIQLYRRETDYWTMRNFTQGDTLELTSVGIHFPVAEVYEKTTFDNTLIDEE